MLNIAVDKNCKGQNR